MKKLLLLFLSHFIIFSVWADHLVGGELYYTYKGVSTSNNPVYTVTLRFFRNMHASVPSINNEPVYVGVYNSSNTLIKTITLPFQKVDTLRSIDFPACVNSSLETIYEVGYFSTEVELPFVSGGYTLAWIRCCRTNLVDNMNLNDGGITLTAIIPGADLVQRPNNSAVFALRDTVLLCNNQAFALEFGAVDTDSDSLSYTFYAAANGASIFDPTPQPENTLTIRPLAYKLPAFTLDHPMGVNVIIDPASGQIRGTAPAVGTYLVTVREFEWRNGKVINQHSKDILLKVKNCSYSVARLKPEYVFCDSLVSFKNEAQERAGDIYHWDFGVDGTDADISDLQRPQYKFAAAGEYNVTLEVNKGKPCPAKATAKVKVYPGLTTGFTLKDSCINDKVSFTDTSHYASGIISKWVWDFGEPTSASNNSTSQHPGHTYTTSGLKMVKLTVATNNGCTGTSYRELNVLPLPALSVLENEITICKGDTVALRAEGSDSFAWVPAGSISNTTIATPLVYPTTTTTYRVILSDAKCTNTDSVVVNVLPFDSVQISGAISICEGDTLQLSASSNAKVVQWLPESYITDSKSFAPLVYPPQTMVFKVIANPGVCQTEDQVTISVLNRPRVNAGLDLQVKEEQSVQLNASGADFYNWWPSTALNNTVSHNPVLKVPIGVDSLSYIVEGGLTNGCTAKDTIVVRVNVVPLVDMPSGFTPNADNKNDIFRPIIKGGYQLEEFVVFNRWGQVLFQTTVAGKGWDGYVGNKLSPTGIYVWTIRARNKTTNAIVSKKGTVMLLH